jgi:hypothetical protein
MPTTELAVARLYGYNSAESSVDHLANSWVAPLAPTGPFPGIHTFLQEQAFGAEDEHLVEPAQQSDRQIPTSFGLRRKLITGCTVVAVLTIGALAYAFRPTTGDKKETETAKTAPAVQSTPAAPVRSPPQSAEPSLAAPTAVAWPDLPPSGIVEAAPQVAPAARNGGSATRQMALAPQKHDMVYLQRPGVNIRSTPSLDGAVLGSAPKGTRFKVTKRNGDWAQVESDRLKGWIKSEFLGPNELR